MIVLDENLPESQRQLLRGWRISIRQIGYELGRKGMQDDEIIPFLLQLRRPTFFTMDSDFYKPNLRHPRYGLIHVDVGQYEAAAFVRRLLRQEGFNTAAERMGTIVRISHTGISVWRLHAEDVEHVDWRS